LLPALAVLACGAGGFAQDLHKDERIGFQVRVPRGWKQIPLRSDEAWIVGKYRAPKPELTVDPASGRTLEHYPELLIVALLDRAPEEPAAGEGEGETKGEEEEDEAPVAKTYRDYKEYMQENYSHGHFVEKEETGTQGGLTVTRLEIKAERDIDFAEKRIVTWVYETEIADVAVHLEVMAESLKKFQSVINDTLKSFKPIPRTKSIEAPLPNAFLSSIGLAKLTPAERKEKKIEAQRAEWERMSADLPDGWTASEIDGIYVLNHADERYARKVVEHIRAIYAWLEETFPEIGAHEYARTPFVRICKDQDEESAFRRGSGTYWVDGTQLVTHKGSRADSWEWEYIGGRTLQIWFLERDPELWGALPSWLSIGLDEVLSAAKLQTGKLEFGKGDRERLVRDYLLKGDEDSISVRALLAFSEKEFSARAESSDWTTWCQAVSLTRYFVGARTKKTRELLVSYLANLRLVLGELEAQEEQDEAAKKVPENEEEEEKLFKEREEWLESRERTILDRTIDLTFPGWSAGDWRGLDREFRRSL